jgi:hypothetical protein
MIVVENSNAHGKAFQLPSKRVSNASRLRFPAAIP